MTQELLIQPLPFQTLILDIHMLCPSCTPGIVSDRTSERCSLGSTGSNGIVQIFRAVGGRGSRWNRDCHPKVVEVCLAGHKTWQFPENRVLVLHVVADSGGIRPCNVSTSLRRRYDFAASWESCSCRSTLPSMVGGRSEQVVRSPAVRQPHLQHGLAVGLPSRCPLLRR